jgi:hypothetical protein
VAVTLQLSLDRLNPQSLILLRIICWLAAHPIPRPLLSIDDASQLISKAFGDDTINKYE